MQSLGVLTKCVGGCAIALLGWVSAAQPGNSQVSTQVSIISKTQLSDVRIAQKRSADDAAELVEDALDRRPTLKQFDLDVDDEGNAIVLTGTVRNASQKALAEEVAKRTVPGFKVVNRLIIQ